MLAFIRMQMKLRWGRESGGDKKSLILSGVVAAVTVAVSLALIYVLTSVLGANVSSGDKSVLVLFITVIEIALIVSGIGMQIRWLYKPSDLKITAQFPLSPFKMFAANLVLVYINLQIYAAVLMIPVLTVASAALGIFGWKFALGLIVAAVLAPMVPFALSAVLSLPVMYMLSVLENRNIIKLAIFVVVLAGFFVLYNFVLTFLADYFIYKNVTDSGGVWENVLSALASPFNLSEQIGRVILFEGLSAAAAAGIVVGASVLLSAAGVALAKPVYERVRRRLLESGERTFTRRSSVTDRGVFAAMFGHEFKEIVRTRVFAYFYLGVAVATPVMVFFCDRLVSDVGAAQLGEGVNFGASMLVIAAFMALINAFSAASLSREGEKFFITKLIPVPYRTQLLIKGLVNLIVSAGALVISVVVIVSLGFVTAAEAAVIAAAGLLLSCGFVLNGLNLNLANPSIRVRSDGGFNEANVTLMMVIGLFLSAAVGIAAIVLPFFIAEWLAYLAAAAVALLYAGANFVVFWFTAQKKYAAVEC